MRKLLSLEPATALPGEAAVAEQKIALLESQQAFFETASDFCSSPQQPAMGVSSLISCAE
jgi:hypothetical protein